MTGEKKSLGDLKDAADKHLREILKNPYFLTLTAILAFSAYIRFSNAFFQGMWVDESIHGRLAKELPKHLLEYSLPQKGGAMVKRPPVYNYLITFSNMIFGGWIGTDTAIRLVSPLVGTVGVASTYFLGREIKGREVGLAAAALVSVSATYWFLSTRILMGATLTALFTTTLLVFYYGLEDRKYSKYAVWAWGPLLALTALSKQPGYVLAPIILVYFLYKKREEISDYLMTDKDLKDSELYGLLTGKNYWIAVGLFMIFMLPWMIRNIRVCGFPFCSFKMAFQTALTDGGRQIDVQGPLYFLLALPGLVTIPVFASLAGKALKSGVESFKADQDLVVKKAALMLLLVGGAFFTRRELVPLFLISSIAMFARNDGEKLLWLASGFGIGLMSLNSTKVPRYIVFVLPALLTLASIGFWGLASWITSNLPDRDVLDRADARMVLAAILLPVLFLSYVQGVGMVSNQSFGALEPAGEWIEKNTRLDEKIVATSPQVRFYAHPRMPVASANRIPDNETAFREMLDTENVSFVMVDVYERTQPKWMNLGLPPYRLDSGTIRDLRSGRLSGRQVVNQYGQVPEYLTAFQSFGETRMPLTNRTQPEAIIYVVNRAKI
jgi:hypothetical protein